MSTEKAKAYFKKTGDSPVIGANYLEPGEGEQLPEDQPGLSEEARMLLKVDRTRVCPSCGYDVDKTTAADAYPTIPDGLIATSPVYACLQANPPCDFRIYAVEEAPESEDE
jgi:hypothetical protein